MIWLKCYQDIPLNFKNKYHKEKDGLFCKFCQGQELFSQSHCLVCPARESQRAGMELKKIEAFFVVMLMIEVSESLVLLMMMMSCFFEENLLKMNDVRKKDEKNFVFVVVVVVPLFVFVVVVVVDLDEKKRMKNNKCDF